MKNTITVAVTAVGAGIGQGVVRSLQRGRFDVRIVGMDASALSAGLFWCDVARTVPMARDADRFVDAVHAVCRDENVDLLIPGIEYELAPLARARERFSAIGCGVCVSELEALELALDKLRMWHFCRDAGLPFVPTHALDETLDVTRLDYPVIVKQRTGAGSVGTRLAASAEDLSELPRNADLIVQDYLPPRGAKLRSGADGALLLDQSDEISMQYFVMRDGYVADRVFASINRLKAGIPMQIVLDDELAERKEGLDIVKALAARGTRGPVNLQGRMTGSGTVFFESNIRYTGITDVRTRMGFREVDAALVDHLNGDAAAVEACLDVPSGVIGLRQLDETIVSEVRLRAVPSAEVQSVDAPVASRAEPVRSSAVASTGHALESQSVLVTGATGFIGSAFLEALLQLPSLERLTLVASCDATRETLEQRLHDRGEIAVRSMDDTSFDGVDTVVHLAADRSGSGAGQATAPDQDAAALQIGRAAIATGKIAAKAAEGGVSRLVLASTQAVYGTRQAADRCETSRLEPETSYALAKVAGEIAATSHAGRGMQVHLLRFAKVWGTTAQTRWSELLPSLAVGARQSGRLVLQNDGLAAFDLVHLDDVVDALLRVCQLPIRPGEVDAWNIGGGRLQTLLQIAEAMADATESDGARRPVIERVAGEAGRLPRFGMSIAKANEHLGWYPGVSLRDGVRQLVEAAGSASAPTSSRVA